MLVGPFEQKTAFACSRDHSRARHKSAIPATSHRAYEQSSSRECRLFMTPSNPVVVPSSHCFVTAYACGSLKEARVRTRMIIRARILEHHPHPYAHTDGGEILLNRKRQLLVYVCMFASTCACMYTCAFVCMHICMHACICA